MKNSPHLDPNNAKITYSSYENSFYSEYERRIKSKCDYLHFFDLHLTDIFGKINKSEEKNTFLVLGTEELRKNVHFHIIDYKDYSSKRSDKLKPFLESAGVMLNNSIKILETNLNGLSNLEEIRKFSLEKLSDFNKIYLTLFDLEENLNLQEMREKFIEIFTEIDKILNKLIKSLVKIKEINMIFVEDEGKFWDLIEKTSSSQLDPSLINKNLEENLKKLKSLEELNSNYLNQNFDNQSEDLVALLGFTG